MKTISTIAFAIFCSFFVQYSYTQNNPSSLLWEISGNGLKQASYIYGTIHIVDKKDFTISDSLKKYLKASKTLALEVDMNMSLSQKITIAKQTFLPDGKTLKDYMKPDEYANFKKFCLDSLHVKEKKFNKYIRIKPFFLSAVLMKEQMKNTESYELTLNKMAKKNKMSTTGLESIQYQLDVVNSLSIEEQITMTIDEINSGSQGASFSQLVNAYKSQDIDAIYNYTAEESKEIPGFIESFIYKRNNNWIPVIELLIAKQKTFIAVGAAHLGGEKGVIELLRKQGFTLRAIKQ